MQQRLWNRIGEPRIERLAELRTLSAHVGDARGQHGVGRQRSLDFRDPRGRKLPVGVGHQVGFGERQRIHVSLIDFI